MISVKFFYENKKIDKKEEDKKINGFSIKGHAQDAQHGESLLCAAVSTISQTTVNGLSEIARAEFTSLDIADGDMLVMLEKSRNEDCDFASQILLKNLKLGIECLAIDAPNDIRIIQ